MSTASIPGPAPWNSRRNGDWVAVDVIPRGEPCGIRTMETIPRGKGFSRHSNKEFIQFLFIVYPVKYTRWILFHGAGGSAAEVQSQLYTALDQGYISQEAFNSIYETLEVVAKQLSRFITYLKESG